jgi:CheY-like chemotaxis protein
MKTILVVDDDLDTRETLVDILRGHGYDAHAAADVEEARCCFSEVTPSVVLVDLALPLTDGASFIESMRLDPALAAVPIVAMSALCYPPALPSNVELLRKPFDLDGLFRALRRATPGDRATLAHDEESMREEEGRLSGSHAASGVFKTPWPRPGLAKSTASGTHLAAERAAPLLAARTGPPFRS